MTKMPKKRPKKSRGEKVIKWIEDHCRIPEGKDVGKRVKLREWQKDDIKAIYDNPAGTRLAIVSEGRKNAKTALAAFLLLAHLAGPVHILNSQLYSSAQSREQAGVIFDLAAKVVRMSETLHSFITIRDTAKQLLCPELGTKYRALSAEVATSFGLSPVFIVHDELGQVRGPKSELYEALETATAAQEHPLSLIISTQAPTDGDLLSILIDDAIAGHDPKVVLVLRTADPDLDPFSEEAIRQANPAFGDFQNAEEVLAMADTARRIPSREAGYRNLVLNQRVEASSPFIPRTLWETCGTQTVEDFDRNTVLFAGLDLSATNDLTALVLIGQINGVWHVKPTFWLPEVGLGERSRLDHVPYDVWYKQGFLSVTPGKSVEYEYVADYLRDEVFSRHTVRKVAFDRWNFKNLRSWLVKSGMTDKFIEDTFFEFGQGYQSMTPALRSLESIVLNQKMAHGNHPILNMCSFNAVVHRDPAGNRKLDKARSRGRIDGMIALAMAVGVSESVEVKPKQFQMMFVG
jgi:phage terminase large subunit-like protein